MMKIYAISDLHGFLPEIPECDLLLLGGDYCPTRNLEQELRFLKGPFSDWLEAVPARYKVGIAGNHDRILEEQPALGKTLPWIYLQDEEVTLESVKIYGTPWTQPFGDWAFMKAELTPTFKKIPEMLDILLTHGPAYGILDKTLEGIRTGSRVLRDFIVDRMPDTVIHGHIHEAHGIYDDGITRFFNVSHVNRDLEPVHGPVYVPLRIG